ncbi:MAG: protease modulator HflC [Candidatus Eisenbacteria bacterium]|uniref:Protein HflC n=1 Tax=Eiseniibacteriota bacterium TaxID=2212470 RepID=A0A937X7M9_UNCEI|nr:protease modulator HflC [Candidatus Eisenbacteria bacterium]
MRRTVALLAAAAAALLLLLSCAYEIQPAECGIVLFFGEPARIVREPGLHWKLPPPIETLVRIDLRLHILDPSEAEYLTLDKKNVLVDAFAAWQVEDPLRYLVTVVDRRTAEAQLEDIVRSELGSALGTRELTALISTVPGDVHMDQIMQGIAERAREKAADGYGILVRTVGLKRLNFPEENRQAIFRRMEAERERIARQYRSEGEEQAEMVRAQADLEQARILAEAERRAQEIRGEADAEAARIYAEAYAEDQDFYEFLRTLAAYEKFIDQDATIVLPSDSRLLRLLRQPHLGETP